MLGYRTLYLNMNSFIEKVALSKLDGTYLKLVNSTLKDDLLILDDFGLKPMDANTRLALLQILEDRYDRKSVIIISQLPIRQWYDYIGEPTLADAIMDRLVANANKIELHGESMRQKKEKTLTLQHDGSAYNLGTDSSDTIGTDSSATDGTDSSDMSGTD